MVGVFVRDQNGGEIFRRATDAGKALAYLAGRKTGVHEDAGFGRLDVGAIAGRAAAEDGEFDGHALDGSVMGANGQFFSSGTLKWNAVCFCSKVIGIKF